MDRLRVAGQRDLFVGLSRDGRAPVDINGPQPEWRHPGNANLRFEGFAADDVLGALQPWLAASTGAACASGIPEPSHVLGAWGLTAEQAEASIRFSFGRFTGDQDVQEAAALVIQALKSLAQAYAGPVSEVQE